jgi:alpha-1,2-mannosyltransferase
VNRAHPLRVLGPLGILAALYYWAVFITTFQYPGAIGVDYLAVGTDYMVFDTATNLAVHHDLGTLYDGDRFTGVLNERFRSSLREALPFRPWIYPPSFLLVLLPFSLFGFYASFGLFQILTAGLLVGSLRIGAAEGRKAWLIGCAALLCPAASIEIVSGQNSFLIAALLIAGAGLIDANPVLAGIAFGLLSIKPQFFLLVPVVLLASRAWRASAAALVTIALMAGAAALLFTPRIWTDWFEVIVASTSGTDPRWFENGRAWGESVFACVFWLGAGPGLASAMQWIASLLACFCVWRAFREPMAFALRTAMLLTAALLAAPHSGGYDLLLLVAASGLLLSQYGQRAGRLDWWLAFFAWMAPLFGVPALSVIGRFGPVLTLALLGRIFWCADARPREQSSPCV